jgi:endonuclease YncB( thermonuclease family)
MVKKVIDGDSLLVVSGKKTIAIRLYGVDCPEYDQPFSPEAKALLRKRVHGKKVLVQPEYYDSYKRLVAIVQYDDQMLNGELVQAGLAWVYPQYCRKKICKSWERMENSAKNQNRGIWSSTPPVPPWKWKRMKQGS